MFFANDKFNASVPAVPNGGIAMPCFSAPTGIL